MFFNTFFFYLSFFFSLFQQKLIAAANSYLTKKSKKKYKEQSDSSQFQIRKFLPISKIRKSSLSMANWSLFRFRRLTSNEFSLPFGA